MNCSYSIVSYIDARHNVSILLGRFRCGDPYIWARCEPDWHVGLWLGGRARGQVHLPPPGAILVPFISHTVLCIYCNYFDKQPIGIHLIFSARTTMSAWSSWRQSKKLCRLLVCRQILFLLKKLVCEVQYWCVSCSCIIATTQWSQCQLQYFHQLWLEVTSGGGEVSFREWRTWLFCWWTVWDRIWRCSRWWVSPCVAIGYLLGSNVVSCHISLGCSIASFKTRIKIVFLPLFF